MEKAKKTDQKKKKTPTERVKYKEIEKNGEKKLKITKNTASKIKAQCFNEEVDTFKFTKNIANTCNNRKKKDKLPILNENRKSKNDGKKSESKINTVKGLNLDLALGPNGAKNSTDKTEAYLEKIKMKNDQKLSKQKIKKGLIASNIKSENVFRDKKGQLIEDQKLPEKQSARNPAVEAATVFVGNLPVNIKREQLVHLFKDYGPINAIRLRSAGGKILYKHKQRREAGSLNAYVVLKNQGAVEKAVSLNGIEFKGRHLRVTSALKSTPYHENEIKKTVFVGNLRYSVNEESLHEIFSSCGEIEYVRCLRDGDKGCKGVAYVCFKTTDAIGLALELNNTVLDERPIRVERFSMKKLGAKEARDTQKEMENRRKTGNKKMIKNKSDNSKSDHECGDTKKPKKISFKGVTVDALKKKQKLKKKKSNNQMLQLAKKIAPIPKSK